MNWLIYIAIFLIPIASIFQVQGTIVWYPQCLAVIILGFLIGSFQIWKINRPMALMSIYCLYSYIFICTQHPRAMLLLVICYAGIGVVCVVSKIKETHNIYKCLIWMSIIQFVLVILQQFNLDPFFWSNLNHNVSESVGFVGSHNQLGIYYAALAPILFHFCMPLLALPVLAIVFSSCSSAAIGALCGITTYIISMRIYYLLWVLVPVVLISFFVMHKFDNIEVIIQNRALLWQQTVKQTISGKVDMDMGNGVHRIVTFSPLTGAGIGNFMAMSPASQGLKIFGKKFDYALQPRWEHAHNDLVEYFFDFGWLALPILLWLMLDVLGKFLLTVKTNMLVITFSSLVAQAVTSLGVYVIHAPVSYFMLCLTLGLFYAEVTNARTISKKA